MVKFSTVTHKLVGLGFDRVSSIGSQFNHPISYKNVKFLPSSQKPTHAVQRSIADFILMKFPKVSKTIVLEGLIKCLLTWHSFIGGQLKPNSFIVLY
jgi:hypothetical protein